MSTYRKLRADRYTRKIEDTMKVLTKLDLKTIAELLRRGEYGTENDGVKSPSLEGSGGGGANESSQTENAALRGLPGDLKDDGSPDHRKDDWRLHEQPDPIGKAIDEALAGIEYISATAREVEKRVNVVLLAAEAFRGRQPQLGSCHACGRDVPGSDADRLRSGYCSYVTQFPGSGCYTKFIRAGRPDRRQFERAILLELDRMKMGAERKPLHAATGGAK